MLDIPVRATGREMAAVADPIPVVALHCSGASGRQWRRLGEVLGRRFRLEAPDLWGCGGRAGWPGRAAHSLAGEAASLLRMIDVMDEPVHLVGHSFGGGVALHIARHRPERIASLSLVEPTAFHLLRSGDAADTALFDEISTVAEDVREAILSGAYRAGMKRFVDYWNGPGAWQAMPPELRDRLVPGLFKTTLDFRALFEEPARIADYARLPIPTLILGGTRSPRPARRVADILHRNLPNGRLEVVADAGHMMPLTHADRVARLICEHIEGSIGAHWKAA